MYLVDSNIWSKLLLEQEKKDEVRSFFEKIESDFLAITEITLYSICLILIKLNKSEILQNFLLDTLHDRM